eukprot:1142067-Pelagomonas_calceolata.AAC.5
MLLAGVAHSLFGTNLTNQSLHRARYAAARSQMQGSVLTCSRDREHRAHQLLCYDAQPNAGVGIDMQP